LEDYSCNAFRWKIPADPDGRKCSDIADLGAKDIETVSLASWGFDAEISKQNSLLGASYAVVESVAKIVAMGGDYKNIRFSFQEYFEKLGQNPEKWGKPLASFWELTMHRSTLDWQQSVVKIQ
jgi:phosphoribosylformylglycinamidine (FGAM) synthase-like enzyme